MKRRRLTVLLIAVLVAISVATPAQAATIDQKLQVLSTWSQSTTASYNAWNSARLNQAAWADYGFDWSTDYCSSSPDNPLGFDFTLSCARHDFGYRNYKAVGQFSANKDRIDSYFYFDLKNKCATYNKFVRPACLSLAWTYYQAVHLFGNLKVSQKDLDKARQLQEAA
jgi:opacity protein-like surface antigen